VAEPHEQALEIVLAGLRDLAAIDLDVVDDEHVLRDQRRHVVAERGGVARDLGLGLLERDEHTAIAVRGRAVDQELHPEQGLAAARATAHQRGPAAGQSAPGDLVEPIDARGYLRQSAAGGSLAASSRLHLETLASPREVVNTRASGLRARRFRTIQISRAAMQSSRLLGAAQNRSCGSAARSATSSHAALAGRVQR
jgi:hypothetical protein